MHKNQNFQSFKATLDLEAIAKNPAIAPAIQAKFLNLHKAHEAAKEKDAKATAPDTAAAIAAAATELSKEKALPTDFVGQKWHLLFPNIADSLQFDYPRLVGKSYRDNVPLGQASSPKTVAVIGAGVAGTQAARELTRAGYNVTLIESSDRIGGRTYSQRALKADGTAQLTSIEQGAMRIPFFNTGLPLEEASGENGDGPWVGGPYHYEKDWENYLGPQAPGNNNPINSLAEMYALKYKISTAAFPDPGKAPLSANVLSDPKNPKSPKVTRNYFSGVATDIYVNAGWGVNLPDLYANTGTVWEKQSSLPTRTFCYKWPASADQSKDIVFPPVFSETPVRFYNRGKQLDTHVPQIKLGHAIPDGDDFIPPTFAVDKDSDPARYNANVAAWKQGVYAFRTVAYKWALFAGIFTWAMSVNARIADEEDQFTLDGLPIYTDPESCSMLYDNAEDPNSWEKFWGMYPGTDPKNPPAEGVLTYYQNVSFADVAVAGPILPTEKITVQGKTYWKCPAEWLKGNFGGLAMNNAEQQVLGCIGCGDGSWGAFFPQSSLWALRALLFGFANQHQLIIGVLNEGQTDIDQNLDPKPDATPYGVAGRATIPDSNENQFLKPQYAGVNSITEMNIFSPIDKNTPSFYDLARQKQRAHLCMSSKVSAVERVGAEDINVTYTNVNSGESTTIKANYLVCTVPIWNCQTDMTWKGFKEAGVPLDTAAATNTSHWIRSAKVFVPLKTAYWLDPKYAGMFQVMATNTELQDWYSLLAPVPKKAQDNNSNGGLGLVSYTWEDDAQKFLPYQQKALVQMLMKKCNEVLAKCGVMNPDTNSFAKIDDFMIDPSLETEGSYSVWRWSLQPQYHGCARAYQPGIENLSSTLYVFNAHYSKESQLYFAGDSFGLTSGWLESALRLGIDATLQILNNDTTAKINSVDGFNFDTDYLPTLAPLQTSTMAQRTNTLGPKTDLLLHTGPGGAGGKKKESAGCDCVIA